jgi:ribosomal protein S12 methylthiotransferase
VTQNKSICVTTLGCVKNLVDSEKLLGGLRPYGFRVTEDPNNTDILVINTCGFIQTAIDENADYIRQAEKLKEIGKISRLYVVGCYSERYKDDFKEKYPLLDGVYGTDFQQEFIENLTQSKYELLGERYLLTPKHYAYMKINDGCERNCAFCSIPSFRGKFKSETIESIIAEAKALAEMGVKELILIAQDLTAYGEDIYDRKALAELLEKLADIEGLKWIRLMYTYPRNFPLEVLDLMAKRPNIAKYIDIPIQHISDNVLKLMGRGITRKETEALLNTMREKVPGIAIRTTVIVGFPNETEENFQELLDFIKEFRFDRFGVFEYSAEIGTPAYQFGDPVSPEIKRERYEKLMIAQNQISYENNQKLIGKELEVLIDGRYGDGFIGRTEFDAPEVDNAVIINSKTYKIGEFAKIRIKDANDYDLIG